MFNSINNTLQDNFASRSVLNSFSRNQQALQVSISRLSTGKTVNEAADDPSGLAIATRYNSLEMGLQQGIMNTQTSTQMLQTAEDGHNAITQILQQMRSLAVRAADGSLNDSERGTIQTQITDLYNEINTQASKAIYNGKQLLDGSFSPTLKATPSSVNVLSNDTLQSGSTLVSTANGGPSVSGNVVNGTFKFTTVANQNGGVDVQVYSSTSRDPSKPVTVLQNLDQGSITTTLGPMESQFVQTGNTPTAAAVTPDGTKAIVVNNADSTVDIRDLTNPANQYEKLASIQLPAGSNPVDVKVDPRGMFAYVLNNGPAGGASSISRINLSNDTLYDTLSVGHNAENMAVTADGNKAFVTNYNDGTVSEVDLNTFSVDKTINVGTHPFGVVASSDGSTVYVANEGSQSVSKIDVASGNVTNIATPGLSPRGLALSANGSKLYIGAKYTDSFPNIASSIDVMDTSSNQLTTVKNVGADPEKISADPNGKYVYVSNVSAGTVTVLNANDYSLHSTLSGEFNPGNVQFFNNGNNGIITNGDMSRVVTTSNPTVATVQNSDQAQFGTYDVKVVQAGTYSASSSSAPVSGFYGIDPTQTVASAGYALTPDTGGTIRISNSNGKYSFTWNNTDTVNQVLSKINNNTIGVTASYNAANNVLSINSPVGVTLSEITNNPGGNGFFAVNHIAADGAGVTYSAGTQSSSYVTKGVITGNTLATAGFADTPATSGTIQISNSNGASKTFHWDASTTVDGLLNAINNPANNLGITAKYDPTKNSLSIIKNPGLASFTLAEIPDGGGKGFFEVNHITAGATGTTYTASVTSNPDIVPGINPNVPMNSAGFSQTFGKGVLMINDGSKSVGIAYDPAVNSENDVIAAINANFGAGTATLDPSNNRLTITKPNFTLYDVPAAGGAPGFFAANYITANTVGQTYTNSVTSSTLVHQGITPTNTLSTAGFELGPTMDSGGVIMVSDGSKSVGISYNKNTTTVQNVLDGINTAFGAGTASYDATHNYLTITRPNLTLYDVTNTPGAQGFFATNKIAVTTNEPGQLNNVTSSSKVAPNPPSLVTTNPLDTAGFFLAPDSSGSFTINSRNTQTGTTHTQTFTWNATTTTPAQLVNQINSAGLELTASYNAANTRLTFTPNANVQYDWNEITSGPNNSGFLKDNYLQDVAAPATSVSSNSNVGAILDLTAPLSQAGFFEPPTSTSGTITVTDTTTGQSANVSYDATTALGDLLNNLKGTGFVTNAQYLNNPPEDSDGLRLQLTMAGSDTYTISETKSSPNSIGFLQANQIAQNQPFSGSIQSAGDVVTDGDGVEAGKAMRVAGFGQRIGESGTVTFSVRNTTTGATQSQSFNWNQNQTVQSFMDAVNGANLGISVGYDASRQHLQITSDGSHTFTFSEIAKQGSAADPPPSLNTANPLGTAGFFQTPDSQGAFTITTRNSQTGQLLESEFTYNAATDTPASLVNQINGAAIGVTASYDASNNHLTLTPGANTTMTYNEITNGANNLGFMAVNYMPGAQQQQTSQTSGSGVSSTLDFTATLANAGFFNPITSTSGTIHLHDNTTNTTTDVSYNQNTTLGDLIIGLRNSGVLSDAFYVADPNGLKLELDFANNDSYSLSETKSSAGAVGFLDANAISQNTPLTGFVQSASDIAPNGNGIDITKAINVAGYFKAADTNGLLTFSTRNTTTGQLQTKTFQWQNTETVQTLLNQINGSGLGITLAYDPSKQFLTISTDGSHTYTASEMTQNGGPGFLDINNIKSSDKFSAPITSQDIVTTGNQVLSNTGLGFMAVNNITEPALESAAVTSSVNVTTGKPTGIDLNAPVATAGYIQTPDSNGTIAIRKNGQTYDFNWTAAGTTTQDFLNFLNGVGITTSYDANKQYLTLGGGPFQAWEATATGGPGLFAINNINIGATTGTSYNGGVTSAQAVAAGIDASKSVGTNPFALTSDTGGQITVKNAAGSVSTFHWDRTATRVQDILNFLNGAGVSASYDAHGDKLTLSEPGNFTLYEATDHGGNGFFAINDIPDTTTGTQYSGSVTSTYAITTPPGVSLTQPLNANHFAKTADTGGVFTISNDQGFSKAYHWSNTDSVQSVINQINADELQSGVSASYSADGSRLTLTKAAGIGSFTLAEITDNNGPGFFAINNISAATAGTTYTATTQSATPVTPGVNLAGKIDASNNFAVTPSAAGGTIDIKSNLGEKTFQWNSNTVVGDLLNQINNSGLGLTVAYDPTGHLLSVTPGNGVTSYTLSELTGDGGPGFFAVNNISASPTGTTYSGIAQSSQPVTAQQLIDEANKPLVDYSYLDSHGNVQKINTGDIKINGQTVSITNTDTLDSVVAKINALAGQPGDATGTHVVASFTEDPNTGAAALTLKDTAYGEAIKLTDPGSTHFFDAMHLASDNSGKALEYTVNGGAQQTSTTADTLNAIPGGDLLFKTNNNDNFTGNFFSDSTAGVYNGPLNADDIITIGRAQNQNSGLSFINNGDLTLTLNQASATDVGKTSYVRLNAAAAPVTSDNSLLVHWGADESEVQAVGLVDLRSNALFGAGYAPTVTSQIGAEDLIGAIDKALKYVDTSNTHLGDSINQLQRTQNLTQSHLQSITQADSILTDTNFPQEVTNLTKEELISQASNAMLAQANLDSTRVLSLVTSAAPGH